jgi:signal transduction histidine kinase/ligand-binding sensor domain-containing protein/CheY-like chemotaxis protein/AraC-like DNA-binding protein
MPASKILNLFLIAFLLCTAWCANAQIKCKIEHYSTEDGLSHNRIMCMLKDRDGFMWFGTWDGLNRFDGHSFVVYKSKPGDTSSLRNNRIENIIESKKTGFLWARAYDNRVYRFDKKTGQFLAIEAGAPFTKRSQPIFTKMEMSKNGHIWLITKKEGIFLVDDPDSAHPHCTRFAQGLNHNLSLPSNNIQFFHQDQQSNIWINTTNGLCVIEKNRLGKYSSNTISKRADFTCADDTKDTLWMGTKAGSLVYIAKSTKQINELQLSVNSINQLIPSKKNNCIYTTSSGAEVIKIQRSNKQITKFTMLQAGQFLAIYEDKAGLLWLEAENYGIVKFDPQHKSFKGFNQKTDAFFDHYVKFYRVIEDNNGSVWVSMDHGGFGYYNPITDNVDYFYDEPGSGDHRFSNIIVCTYMDPAGVLWLNADDKGLNKIVFQRNDFNQKLIVNNTVNRSDNEIRGLCHDSENRLWMASKSGNLYIYKDDHQVPVSFVNTPKDGMGVIYTITQDKEGAIWIGTRSNGLFKAVPLNTQHTTYKLIHFETDKNDIYSLNSNVIYSLLEDSKGRMWVGTYENGLNLVDDKNGQIKFLNIKNSFKNYPKKSFLKIRNLKEDAKGNIWLATTDGLLIVDPDQRDINSSRFASFSKISGDRTSLSKNDIQFIYRDSKAVMWLCTSGGGLDKAIGDDPFKKLNFKVYTTEDGLTSDYVLSCVEDNNSNLWLATENGLSKFNPQSNTFRNYDSYDGLPKTGFSESSSLKLPNGNLVFGGLTGYVSFNPLAILSHKIFVNMAFTNLQVNNKDIFPDQSGGILKQDIDQTPALHLQYNQNIITVDYTILDYRLTTKQFYAYRLVGFDNVWHDNKGQRRATYTNLPPGDYKFEVKSTATDLYSNTPYKSLAITIFPPPWRTWWAYLIYIVITSICIEIVRRIALTMLKLRHRIAVEQKMADLKVSFFTNVSHELRTPLTLILNPIEEIYNKESLSHQGNEHIHVVRKNAKRMVRFINQLLDLRKVQSGKATLKLSQVDIVSFLKKISEYFTDVAREKHIDLQITVCCDVILVWIDVEKIDVVIYNLLANAFKFSPANKKIRVSITQSTADAPVSIEISDQGQGVPENKLQDIFELYYEGDHNESKNLKGTGIGLALSKELVELHQGKISAKNNSDKGLTVSIELKTGKEHFADTDVVFVDVPEVPHEFEEAMEGMLLQTIHHPKHQHAADVPLVLLVEDNSDLRIFLATQLSDFYRVEVAENGEEGLNKAINLLPDLVLSDVMMPKMDGIQMLDELKNNILTSHIPVVLLSAKFSVESQIEGLKYGADYYITKPFDNGFLLASIENLIRQRKKIFDTILNGKKTIALNPAEIVITSHDEIFLKKIIKIVEERMADPEFNIESVSEAVNLSRSAFYKKFKSLTNIAPVEFVREMRLKRARQMLDAGENNMTEIAYAVGFNNSRYFSTCFKELYHMSPTDYLKSTAIKA